jgi:hypothetical protein
MAMQRETLIMNSRPQKKWENPYLTAWPSRLENPASRSPLCLIPLQGFAEWKQLLILVENNENGAVFRIRIRPVLYYKTLCSPKLKNEITIYEEGEWIPQ